MRNRNLIFKTQPVKTVISHFPPAQQFPTKTNGESSDGMHIDTLFK